MAPAQSCTRAGQAPGDSGAAQSQRSRAGQVVRLKVAILGTRGVPPNYGGFETFAAELGTRLVQRGDEVTVYCRWSAAALPPLSNAPEARSARPESGSRAAALQWNGIRRIVLPALGHKYLETVSHSFLSALDALKRDFDAVLLCNAANAF